MSINDDDGFARSVRELIKCGRLPSHPPARVWAGYGPGADCCDLCGALVPANQVVMEAVFGGDEGRSLFFHRDCFYGAYGEWQRYHDASISAVERAPPADLSGGQRADSNEATK